MPTPALAATRELNAPLDAEIVPERERNEPRACAGV